VSLFLLGALPLGALFIVLLPWDAKLVPHRPYLATVFLRGMLWALPAWAAVLVFRALVGDPPPLTGFRLYLTLLVAEQVLPIGLGLAAFLLAQRRLEFPHTEEGILLVALCFLSGFLSVLDIAEFLRSWQAWDAHALFLLPLQRFSAALSISMAAHRFYRWEGSLGWLLAGLTAAALPVLAVFSFLFEINLVGVAWGLGCALFAAAAVLFALRYARVLRG
jgi:hypothetical protein